MKRLLVLFAFIPAIASASLDGLWAARRDFGPEIRGPLRVSGEVATIAGRRAAVKIDHDKLAFDLPNGEGAFRGTIRGDRVVGHWIQPSTVWGGREYATPVTLMKRAGGWVGEVRPMDDHMTLFLPISGNSAYLRNPERNIGRFIAVQGIAVDGAHIKLLGKDDAPVAEGTLADDVMSIAFPQAGGTFDFHRATAADEAVFYPRGTDYRKPAQLDDGWPVATLDDVGISREAIAKFVAKLNAVPMDSVHASWVDAVLIARHGKLVLEEYFHADNPDEPHDTRSAAKSLTDILVGAAKLPETTPVYATMQYPTDDARKRAMTVANLLAQNSGLDCDDNDDNSPGNEDVMQQQTAQPDWYLYTLALKNIRPPGEKSVYCSCQPNLAGGVLQRKVGRSLPDLFRDLIADPMQMRKYAMFLSPTGDPFMGGGIRLTTRDFLKIAQMMMNGGRWNGKRIVSAEWAKKSTSPLTVIQNGRKYGYLWYVFEYPYKGRTIQTFCAAGNGGQIAMAVPELDMAIAFNGGNYTDAAAAIPARDYVPQDILPAVK